MGLSSPVQLPVCLINGEWEGHFKLPCMDNPLLSACAGCRFAVWYAPGEESPSKEKKLSDLLAKAREKNIRQRTELRRLNKRLEAMWRGVRFSHATRDVGFKKEMV